MRRALLYIVGLITLTFAAPACATFSRAGGPSSSHYFVEFRARDGISGHTYLVYGKIDGRGRILSARAGGFHPYGAFSETALTLILPFPGRVGLQPADRTDPPSAIYRLYLNADTYARLVSAVKRFRQMKSGWDLLFFNCNAFAGRMAQAIGLRVPSNLELPVDFVRDLYLLNRPYNGGTILVRRGSKRR
jgi:hypothetical protein